MTDIEKVARAICKARYGHLRGYAGREATYEREAQATIAAMQPAPQWQGIESAPRDRGRTTIIAAWRCAYSGKMRVSGDVHNIDGAWYSDGEGIIDATHWMPLPTPPAGGSDEQNPA